MPVYLYPPTPPTFRCASHIKFMLHKRVMNARESLQIAAKLTETRPQTAIVFLVLVLTLAFVLIRYTMAEASAADGKMKDLSLNETKKKEAKPPKAAKKPQQPKKKVGPGHIHI